MALSYKKCFRRRAASSPCSVCSLLSESLPSFAFSYSLSPYFLQYKWNEKKKKIPFHLSIVVELYSGNFFILGFALSIFLISPLSCFFGETYEKLLWERRWRSKHPSKLCHSKLWQHCTISVRHGIADLNTKTAREVSLCTRKIAVYQHRNMRSRNL